MVQLQNIIESYKLIVPRKLNNKDRCLLYTINEKIQITKWHIQYELIFF